MLTTTYKTTIAEPAAPVVEPEHLALIKLLGDDDPLVYHAVREKIISLGSDTRIWLKPCQNSNDATVRRHATEIVRHFDQSVADTRFMSYCLQEPESIDLEQGALLLAQTEYPHLDAAAYSASLDHLAQELREWLAATDPQQRLLPRVNQFLFDEKGFTGNMENCYDPENTFINQVLDRRTGNPVGMCLLYTLLMRRLDFPVNPIGLPGHSVCQYKDEHEEVYIDAFNLGKLLTRHDCIEHLKRCRHEVRDEYLQPMTARRTLARMCGNLEQIYMEMKRTADSGRFQRYLFALTR